MSDQPAVPVLGRVTRDGDDVVIRLPVSRAHDLRVALAHCPCGATKATAGQALRDALSLAIGKAAQ
jgi:hypothetical protein